MSNTSHEATEQNRHLVEVLASVGTPEETIARLMQIDPKTLRKHYREELDFSHIKANAKVANNLFKIATGTGREAVTAAIFWLKTRAGWSEYSPPPKAPRVGKKVEAQIEAATADQESDWGDLVRH